MRTEEKWARQKFHIAKKLFPERLCRDLKEIPAPEKFSDFDLEQGQGLFIHGPVKTGKTVYAAQLALDVQRRWWLRALDKRILFVTTPQIFQEIKTTYDTAYKGPTESEILQRYQGVDLLVLDELGMGGKISDWLIDLLYLLINERWERLKPTIITSNSSLPELAELFGDTRIPSRIERMCKVIEKRPWKNTV